MKASDLMVKCLENEQIEYIFGVPGEENADFMISLEQSDSIQFILTRHEQGAAFMAEVYGRLTGRPAGCLGTLGPGATNLMTGVADANMDRAPLLALTGQGSTERLHKESHQIMDVVGMFRPVTKWTTTILHPDNINEVVSKAIRLAKSEKPGAVHVELPEDIAKLESTNQPVPSRPVRRAVPGDKVVDQAYAQLKSAKRPVILAGNGAVRKRASTQLRLFCEKTGIGVINTFMAKGCVDRDADYSLFTIGLQARDHVYCAIEAADTVIALGYDMVEYHPQLWNPDGSKRIIHIDFDEAEVDENYLPEIEVVGDLAHTLWMLNERIDADDGLSFELSHQKTTRDAMLADFAEHAEDDAIGAIKPQKALWDARQVMGAHDILLSDVGAHKMWIARYYQCHEPNTCLIPNGFCSMGFALPGAIAAHLVYPDRRILGISGDAGFLMNVQEMETARRLNSNIVMMIWEDNAYGLIAWKQDNEFHKHTDLSFGNPDWVQLSQAFGWSGHRVEKSTELAGTLEQAFEQAGPSLVVIPIDYHENTKLTQRLGNIACSI